MITQLETVVPPPPGKPSRGGTAANQRRAEQIALSPDAWTHRAAEEVVDSYARLAERWDRERGYYRLAPIRDALTRGGPWQRGLGVEIGAGTGLLTPSLLNVWNRILCVDLSADMLCRNPHRLRVRADAAHLPLPADVATVVVIGDGPLFAAEVDRVLRRDGAVVWCNALGTDAPQHVRTEVLVAALSEASRGDWDAVQSHAGWGTWVVLRRATPPRP